MPYAIILSLINGSWHSKNTDPQVKALFGTDTIPTAFTASASPEYVLARIKALNPNSIATLAPVGGA